MYGLFIVGLYVLPIAALVLLSNLFGTNIAGDIFNALGTHWIPNLIFFVIFMIFAASFFGAFEITMPSSLVNKSDEGADKGGLLGIFFMALTLVLVSFSCTGPIVGSVIISSTSGGVWMPIITMAAFAIAFALPFTVLAWFPSLLKNMPKSGGWLNSVKVVLGFIEVALGLKFLMTADQTMHWGLLDREVYLAIWIVTFTLLGFYLLGKLRFAHDDEVKHVSVFRLTLAIGVFSFVVYMIPGMFGAPLNAISGYIPPMTSQDFQINGRVENVNADRKYADFLHLPHSLEGHFDFEEAVADAKKQNKPIFVDVTGHACNNCREMETMVWSHSSVLPMLRNDFVICALYVDDNTKVEGGKRLGSINSKFAQDRWGVNAQPGYILLSPDGETVLAGPRGYNTNIEEFVKFLETAKNAM
jgi:thiol:disulfide interchange protein DsbD